MALRKRKQPAPPVELRPPLDPAPWRIPPPGSMGDAWDDLIVIREEPPAPAPPTPRKRRRKQGRRDVRDVVFLEYRAQIHPGAVVTWVLVALAVFSTGPANPLMSLVALAAIFSGCTCAFLLWKSQATVPGFRSCVVGIAAAFLLILLDAWKPRAAPYIAWFEESHGGVRKTLTFEEKIAYVEEYMPLISKAVMCSRLYLGDKAVGVGRDGLNRDVKYGSEYFRISTLIRIDAETAGGLTPDMLVYTPDNVPPDPFADDPNATFGVFVGEHYVLVYSIGPDGVWQINPRRPVDPETRNPLGDLQDELYSPLTGTVGTGDIVMAFRLEEDEGLSFFCDDIRQQFEAFGEGDVMKVK